MPCAQFPHTLQHPARRLWTRQILTSLPIWQSRGLKSSRITKQTYLYLSLISPGASQRKNSRGGNAGDTQQPCHGRASLARTLMARDHRINVCRGVGISDMLSPDMFRTCKTEVARLALLVLASCIGVTAASRDYWLKTERHGVPFAWEHITVTELPDGKLRYDYSNQMRIGNEVGKDQEEKISYIVDTSLRPVSFTRCKKENSVETCSSGQRNGSGLIVTGSSQKPLRFDSRECYFDGLLEDLIVRNAGRHSFKLRLLDTDKLTLGTTRVVIRGMTPDTIEAEVNDSEWAMLYRLSRDGRILERRIDIGHDVSS